MGESILLNNIIDKYIDLRTRQIWLWFLDQYLTIYMNQGNSPEFVCRGLRDSYLAAGVLVLEDVFQSFISKLDVFTWLHLYLKKNQVGIDGDYWKGGTHHPHGSCPHPRQSEQTLFISLISIKNKIE